MEYPAMRGKAVVKTLVDGTAIVFEMADQPLPATVWAVPASGDTVTISYSVDNGVTYTTIVATTVAWEVRFDSGITHLQGQRTAGTGTTSTFGAC